MKYIIPVVLLLLFTTFFNYTNAQTINICGSDTIILTAGNYQSGTIQWEKSLDNIDWVDIEGENDTTYTFFPSETKYYRARACFSGCPNEFSEVSYVQIPPKANAGANRIVSSNSIQLMANTEEGSQGTWDILSGINGSLTDVNNPYATLQGDNSSYDLVWSLSNTCGTSTDTITIDFIKNEYSNNIALIDTTDTILSNTNQLSNGIYIIKFGTAPPSITDSTVLIGIGGEGFIRKVESFTMTNDVYTIQTIQADLTDITINGAFNLGDMEEITSTSLKSTSPYKNLNHLPTRQELTTDSKFKTDRYFYTLEDKVEYIRPGVSYNTNTLKSSSKSDPLIGLEFNDTIWSNEHANLRLSGYYRFDPNIVVDININHKWYGRPYLKTFKSGMYNGTIESHYKIEFDASAEANLVDKTFEIFSKKKTSIFVIGGVPVTVTSKVAFEGALAVDVDASIHVEHGQTHVSTYTAAIEYHKGDGWSYLNSKKEQHQMENLVEVNGNLTQTFEIGPSVSFKIYGIVGPYVQARLTEDFNICAGASATEPELGSAGWQANLNIGGSITVGAKAKVASIELFNVKKTWEKGFYHLQFPSKLNYVSGNNQFYEDGKSLGEKIKIKAKSNKGFIVPGTIVHFTPLDGGSVKNEWLVTNTKGEASTYWTPGGEKTSALEVTATDCDGNDLNKSPITFYAFSNSAGLACSNSSLSASLKKYKPKFSFNYYELTGNLGEPPYSYSEDGIYYSNIAPKLYSYEYKYFGKSGTTYLYYVKDNNGCVAMTSYTVGTCKNSDLALNTKITGDVITAEGVGGSSPYLYAIEDLNGDYSTSNTFTDLSIGNHVIYVKDDAGCTSSSIEYVPFSLPPIVAQFTVKKIKAAVNDHIQFQDLSNNSSDWLWDFGDGTSSTEQDPSHMYSEIGTYTVSLVASNATSTATKIHKNLITVGLPPVTQFTVNLTSVSIGESISFTNQSTNSPTSYFWDFGDGETATDKNPTHTYSSVGDYTVKLTTTNDFGSNSLTQNNYITINEANTFTDKRDDKVYGYVTIGEQTWMTENLAWMPSVQNPIRDDYWEPTTTPMYYVFGYEGNDVAQAKASANYKNYGVLYNVPASKIAAPEGWHIPTAEEWQALIDFVASQGYENKVGDALKSCRQVNSPSQGACETNEHPRWSENTWEYGLDAFGFGALPGGEASAEMGSIGNCGMWWAKQNNSSDTEVPFFVIDPRMENNAGMAEVETWGDPILGYSIRCIKDK